MTDPTLTRSLAFLADIGLPAEQRELPPPTVLPGISVERGVLLVDPPRVTWPGDLLHEAGHLAVLPREQRLELSANVGDDGGNEMGAIAWSYAAAQALGLPIEVVFHDCGYKGGAAAVRAAFADGRYFGVPILEWRGLTDYQQPGAAQSATRYPRMKKWLCD